jgi:hypothetical protein
MTTALSKQETSDLRACEQIINNGMMTFRKVGQALCKIRDDRLYKSSHKSFEAYCNERWNFGRSYAARLIQAADVPEQLPDGTKLNTEGAVRKYLQEQKQVADDSDDDQADGGAAPVTSGPLAEMEADPVGVSEPVELDRVRWTAERLNLLWSKYNVVFGRDAAWCYFSTAWEQFKESAGYE